MILHQPKAIHEIIRSHVIANFVGYCHYIHGHSPEAYLQTFLEKERKSTSKAKNSFKTLDDQCRKVIAYLKQETEIPEIKNGYSIFEIAKEEKEHPFRGLRRAGHIQVAETDALVVCLGDYSHGNPIKHDGIQSIQDFMWAAKKLWGGSNAILLNPFQLDQESIGKEITDQKATMLVSDGSGSRCAKPKRDLNEWTRHDTRFGGEGRLNNVTIHNITKSTEIEVSGYRLEDHYGRGEYTTNPKDFLEKYFPEYEELILS